MKIAICLEQRFEATSDGAVWGPPLFGPSFWERYLNVFESVLIIARVKKVVRPSKKNVRVDSDQVSMLPLPHYVGANQFLRTLPRMIVHDSLAVPADAALLFRVSSPLARLVLLRNGWRKRPYGLEVVGDPFDVLAPGVIDHPLRPVLRRLLYCDLRFLCRRAAAIAYVTDTSLQERYPAKAGAYTTSYSSIDLPDGFFSATNRDFHNLSPDRPPRLVFVGTLDTLYKGPDILIDAVGLLRDRGLIVELSVAGEGRERKRLEGRARELGLSGTITFLGFLSGYESIAPLLDQSDVFVLPSSQEGLPRAMIEAMARGLPCIGTTIGGIPELLPPEDMIGPRNATALADKIQAVLSDPRRMRRMSARNRERAQSFRAEILRERRESLYQHLTDVTARWMEQSRRDFK